MTPKTSLHQSLKSGLALLAAGDYTAVHSRSISMIKADVNNPVPYCLLGLLAQQHLNHIKACELFERAARLAPDSAEMHAYHGQALTTLGHQNLAKQAADRAANLISNDPLINDTIGVIYSRTGFHELAIPYFEKAVSLNPEPANFHYNLAASRQFIGDFEGAENAYQATLKRDPNAYRAWSSLISLKRQSSEHNYLEHLKSLFKQYEANADAALHIGHAIAKTLEDLELYSESLDWLHRAKRLKLANSHEHTTLETVFAAAQATRPSIHNAAQIRPTERSATQAPIFIIGLPRTGTTLVDRILSSHPDVTSAGELNTFPGLIKEATATPSNLVLDAPTMQQANKLDLQAIGQAYLESTQGLVRNGQRIIDKMPLNFFYAGLINQALPDAHIVVLRRGAMDSCLSNYRQLLTVQHSYYHYTYDLNKTANFYRAFDQLMSHWRAHIPSDRFMEIQYENIVFDQENQTRRLLDFCGLDWHEACLRFHENTAPVATASSVQVRQPLYSGSIGRWKKYGDKLDPLKLALADLAD
ncbi:tetratricopeptide repeat-containing sulfotransferase family protein [Arenicella xantha]|uniref:Tetratricopeptide repeat protein n=1 Tax=Arenicella xantha TaxID=644221 RepID=A0A395JPS0_9GAMM|nr:sulfotransferase [Arenicella xantha]RBP53650.1 tetratricopeptide repeat protein [Arenicella xantha]